MDRDSILRAYFDWMDAARLPKQRLPVALQLPINDICNSRCQMCHIWQRKRDRELSTDELHRILSNSLYRRIENVGINGGEPTLRKDFKELAAIIVATLPSLKSVSLITNAIRSESVIAAIESLGRICRDGGKRLDVMVSLDGIGAVHDRVRGVPGNYEGARRVISHLGSSTLVDSFRIGCTIIRENVLHVEEVLEFAQSESVYARFRLGVPHKRLYTEGISTPFDLSFAEVFHLASFLDHLIQCYEKDDGRREFYRSLRNQLVYDKPRAAGCAWKNRGVTLGPRGETAFCAVASPELGNALTTSPEKQFWDSEEILEGILKNRCSSCRHDYDGIGDRRLLIRIWGKRLLAHAPRPMFLLARKAHHWLSRTDEWIKVLRPRLRRNYVSHNRARRRVLFIGWYGTETIGDKAILAGLCETLVAVWGPVEIDVASLEPYITLETLRTMPGLPVRATLGVNQSLERIISLEYDLVAVAGGPLMSSIRETLTLKMMIHCAQSCGVKCAILGCGIGPMYHGGARRHALKWLVRNVEYCVVRDRDSERLTAALGRKKETVAALDPAFLWTGLRADSVIAPSTRRKILFALRDWPLSEYAGDLNAGRRVELRAKFEAGVALMIEALAAKGFEIGFVCMNTHVSGGDDRWFYRRILGSYPELKEKVAWCRNTPSQDIQLFREADGIVAMRFHACVFSISLNKPFVALDYTRGGKIEALLRDTGNIENRVVIDPEFDAVSAADLLVNQMDENFHPRSSATIESNLRYHQVLGEIWNSLEAESGENGRSSHPSLR